MARSSNGIACLTNVSKYSWLNLTADGQSTLWFGLLVNQKSNAVTILVLICTALSSARIARRMVAADNAESWFLKSLTSRPFGFRFKRRFTKAVIESSTSIVGEPVLMASLFRCMSTRRALGPNGSGMFKYCFFPGWKALPASISRLARPLWRFHRRSSFWLRYGNPVWHIMVC